MRGGLAALKEVGKIFSRHNPNAKITGSLHAALVVDVKDIRHEKMLAGGWINSRDILTNRRVKSDILQTQQNDQPRDVVIGPVATASGKVAGAVHRLKMPRGDETVHSARWYRESFSDNGRCNLHVITRCLGY